MRGWRVHFSYPRGVGCMMRHRRSEAIVEIDALFEAYWTTTDDTPWERRLELRAAIREAAERPVTAESLVRLLGHLREHTWYPLSIEHVRGLIRSHRCDAAAAAAASAAAEGWRGKLPWFADTLAGALGEDDAPFQRSLEGVVLEIYDEVACRFIMHERSVYELKEAAFKQLDEAQRVLGLPPSARAAALVALYPARGERSFAWWYLHAFNNVVETLQRDLALTLDAEQIVRVAETIRRRDLNPLFEPADFVRLLERSGPVTSTEAREAIRTLIERFDYIAPLGRRLTALADGRVLTRSKRTNPPIVEAFPGGWIRLANKRAHAKSADWLALAAAIVRADDPAVDLDYADRDALSWPTRVTAPLVKSLQARIGTARVVTLGCLEPPAVLWVVETRNGDLARTLVKWLALHVDGERAGSGWEQTEGLCYAGEEIGFTRGMVRVYPGTAVVSAFGIKLEIVEAFLAEHPPSELLA